MRTTSSPPCCEGKQTVPGMLKKIETTANDALEAGRSVLRPPRVCRAGEEENLPRHAEARREWRRRRHDSRTRSAAPASVRRSSATRSSRCRWPSSSPSSSTRSGYALYISCYDWGVFGKIELRRLDRTTASCAHDEIFWRAIKNTLVYTVSRRPARDGARLCLLACGGQRLRSGARRSSGPPSTSQPSRAPPRSPSCSLSSSCSPEGLFNGVREALGPRSWLGARHCARVDHGPEHLDHVRDHDAVLPRLAPEDRGARSTRRRHRRDETWQTFWRITFPLLKPPTSSWPPCR